MSLRLQGLVKVHPGGKRLFQGLNFQMQGPEFVAIVGPSGCGKSSLLRLIAGLDQPSEGTIQGQGLLSDLGFVFQEPRLLAWRNVRENLLLPFEIRKRPCSAEALQKGIEQVRLHQSVLDLFPHQLSGGMKMRASLARALLSQPKLLLLDEPLSALDESTRQILQEEIAGLHEASPRPTLFVTHSLSEALFLADRILILGASGETVREKTVTFARPRKEELRTQPAFISELAILQKDFRQSLAEAPANPSPMESQ